MRKFAESFIIKYPQYTSLCTASLTPSEEIKSIGTQINSSTYSNPLALENKTVYWGEHTSPGSDDYVALSNSTYASHAFWYKADENWVHETYNSVRPSNYVLEVASHTGKFDGGKYLILLLKVP